MDAPAIGRLHLASRTLASRLRAMHTTTETRPVPATPRIPKTVKTKWHSGTAIAASADGSLVVAAGSGDLVRLDTTTWKLEEWEGVDGFVNALAISPDGQRVAIANTHPTACIEIRDARGNLTHSIKTKNNARMTWSPTSDMLVARIEGKKHERLALIDPAANKATFVDLGAVDSVAACFVADGSVLAFVRRANRGDDTHHVLRVDRKGKVEDRGETEFRDSYRSMLPLGDDRFVLHGYNRGWWRVDARGTSTAKHDGHVNALCVDGDGFAFASSLAVTRASANGTTRSTLKAKKRVDAIASARGYLLLLEGNQIEIA
jgi:dipeptidyl aminopeptidase/acylaminoacyl peptidase